MISTLPLPPACSLAPHAAARAVPRLPAALSLRALPGGGGSLRPAGQGAGADAGAAGPGLVQVALVGVWVARASAKSSLPADLPAASASAACYPRRECPRSMPMLPPCQHRPPCPPSLAYRRYVASTIIGATTLQQLAENIAAFELDLDPATLAAVDAIHMSNRNPNVTD